MNGEEMAMSDFELQKAYAAKWEELERNAKYRQEAVQPMVEKLFEISLKLDTVNTLLMTQNDLLAELIRRTGR